MGGRVTSEDRFPWLLDAADLLAQPDPGPTPWLVESLIVDRAVIACAGKWKTTKSYGLLDICISIASGEPAFGKLEIPNPGQVVYICEESGQAALWRRLDSLCRGRAINPERLRDRLLLAANRGVKLDDPEWQEKLFQYTAAHRTRLIVFDPLARMKAPGRNENAQNEIAAAIEFMRELREHADSAVAFVHHTGHQGNQMRGSSDLESVWESRLHWTRDDKSPLVTIESEHREAESAGPIAYRIGWDAPTRTMRFEIEGDQLEQQVRDHLAAHPDASANDVYADLGGNRKHVLAAVKKVKARGGSEFAGTTRNHPPESISVGGSPDTPFRGSGTTTDEVVPESLEPPYEFAPLDDLIPEGAWIEEERVA
jgi:AAA domain-containing protein